MTFDAHAYAIQTQRITDHGETYFKATVAELPHLATYESTPSEAYNVLIEDIEVLQAAAVKHGHSFPEPATALSTGHSGRITLRLPRALHRTLDKQAAAEGVSLNLHVVTLLAQGSTHKDLTVLAGESIKAVARSAITAAALLRGEERSTAYASVLRPNIGQELASSAASQAFLEDVPGINVGMQVSRSTLQKQNSSLGAYL